MSWRLKAAVAACFSIALVLATGSVRADPAAKFPARTLASTPTSTIAMTQPVVPCTCRFQGQDVNLGETICIRGKQATCGRVLNNTSWRFSEKPCLFLSARPDMTPRT